MIHVDLDAIIATSEAELAEAQHLVVMAPANPIAVAIAKERQRVRDRLMRQRESIATSSDPDKRQRERVRLIATIYALQKEIYDRVHASVRSDARPIRPLGMGDPAERALGDLLRNAVIMPSEEDLRHVLAIREAEAIDQQSVQWLGAAVWRENSYAAALTKTLSDITRRRRPQGSPRAADELAPHLARIAQREAAAREPHLFEGQLGELGHMCRTCGHGREHSLHEVT